MKVILSRIPHRRSQNSTSFLPDWTIVQFSVEKKDFCYSSFLSVFIGVLLHTNLHIFYWKCMRKSRWKNWKLWCIRNNIIHTFVINYTLLYIVNMMLDPAACLLYWITNLWVMMKFLIACYVNISELFTVESISLSFTCHILLQIVIFC